MNNDILQYYGYINLNSSNQMAQSEELSIIPTKCMALKKGAVSKFQVVVHNQKRKQTAKTTTGDDQSRDSKPEPKEIDMKRARYDVFKFGMSGLQPNKKQEAKVALAISLGAKPSRRNKRYNYKEYKVIKEKQVKEKLEQEKMLSVGKIKGKPNFKGKRKPVTGKLKPKKDGILDLYGKAGKVRVSKTGKKK